MERVATMDGALAQSLYESHAVQLVYETPLTVDYVARPYRLAPSACELPEVSPDGLVYVFRLRSRDLTADDIVRSLERLRDPAVVSPNGWMLKSVGTIRARDPRTVEIVLTRRCHFFPWLMAMTGAAIRKPDGSGTGPYELTEWWKNHRMVFRRREAKSSGEGSPFFDEVRYLVVDDASTQWLMFLKGELDYLGNVSRDNWDAVVDKDGRLAPELAAQGIRMVSYDTLDVMHIGFNMKDPVVGPNRKLRQALSCAFNYPAWEDFLAKRVIESNGPVPPGVDGRIDAPSPYRFDLAKAERLIAEAGYPNGIDPQTGRRLVLTLAIGRASQDSRESGELLASFFAKIGVRLELAFYTWDAFLKAVNEGRVQMFNLGWVGDYPDAENFLQLFYSSNVSPGPNHANYANPAFDRAYDAALAASDVETRNRHWRTCQEIVREDCPWIFTHYNKANCLVRDTVGNYIPSVFSQGAERYYRPAGRKEGK